MDIIPSHQKFIFCTIIPILQNIPFFTKQGRVILERSGKEKLQWYLHQRSQFQKVIFWKASALAYFWEFLLYLLREKQPVWRPLTYFTRIYSSPPIYLHCQCLASVWTTITAEWSIPLLSIQQVEKTAVSLLLFLWRYCVILPALEMF